MTLDTGHVVAFDDTIHYAVRKSGGWKSTLLGGEGLVTDFTGPGRLLLQTRNSSELEPGWPNGCLPSATPRPRSPQAADCSGVSFGASLSNGVVAGLVDWSGRAHQDGSPPATVAEQICAAGY